MSHYGEPLINDVLINHIHNGMKLLYKESYELNKNDPIIVFQVALSKIKDISQTNLEEEYNRLLQRVENHGNDEEFIERMFELIYRNTTKYLMETEKGYIVDNVHEIPLQNLNISSNKYKTLHLFTLESARGLYTKANLYYDRYSKEDQEKNYEQGKYIIRNSIIKCVKRRVNLNALYDYFEEKYNKESSSSEEEIIDYHDHIMEQNLELQESRHVETPLHHDNESPLLTGGHNLQENYDSDSSSSIEEDENQKEEQMHEVSSEDEREEQKEESDDEDEREESDNKDEKETYDEEESDNKDETKDEEENDFKIIKVQESSSSSEEELKKEDDIKHIKLVYNQSEDSESEKDDSEEEKSIISNSSQDSIDIKDIINELKE